MTDFHHVDQAVSVNLCVLLWAQPERQVQLIAYEDKVLTLLERHGGALLQRLRTDGADGAPLEMHVIRFSSDEAYESYLNDERRVSLQSIRDDSIARTEVHRVSVIAH